MNLAITDLEKEKSSDTTEYVNSAAEISALKQEIKNLQAQLSTRWNNQNKTFNRNSQNQNRQPRRNPRFTRQFYCWTHGAGHSGRNCMNPAEGHQADATFRNRMGGSNYGCYPNTPRHFTSSQNRKQNNSNQLTQPNDNDQN